MSASMSRQIAARAQAPAWCLQGAFFVVAATNPAQRQVVLTAVSFRAFISPGDTLAGFSSSSQPLGSVSSHAPSLHLRSR